MFKHALHLSVACFLILFVGLVPVFAEEKHSTREDFREFGNMVEGRWVGDITLIADWPGQAKKQGEKITGYSTYKWIADGKGIEWVDVGGTTTAKTLITFDPSTRYIKTFNVGSGGSHWQTVIWKKSDKEWCWKLISGGLSDGRKFGGEGSWLFKADGKSFVLQGDVMLNDEKLPRLHDVYTRVNE